MSKSPKKTGSILSRQLLTPLGISLAIVGFTTLWINYHFIRTDLEDKVQQKAQSITQGIEFGTESLIEFEQTSILRRTVQNYATLTDVIEVAIVNPDGLTIANSSEFVIGRPYRPEFSQWMEQAVNTGIETSYKTTIEGRSVLVNILPFSSTIFGVSGRRGLIVVILDLHKMQQKVRRTLFASTATFLVGIILILAILAILLDRKIFRPLQILHQAIGESKKSNDFVLTQPMSANEIGFLADTLADTFQQRNQIEATLEKQVRRITFLEYITQKIRQSLDIQTIMYSAANQIGLNFNISYCHIYLYRTKSLPKIPLIAEYVDRDNPSSKNFLSYLEENLYIQELLKQDRAIAFANVEKEPLLEEMKPLCRELKIKSMLGVRTSYQEKTNGIIILNQCDRYREWTKGEIDLLEAVAAKVGIALAQAQLLKQEKEQKIQLDRQNQLLQQEITEREQAQQTLKLQHLKFQLFAEIALKIRQSLDFQDILQTTVTEVQKILLADRIVIYRLEDDGSGYVLQEEMLPEWSSMLDLHCTEEVFPLKCQKQYEQNKVVAIESTETAYAEQLPCMYDFARKWSIKAKLVAAIWQEQNLWGFIIAHQCSAPRIWKEFDRKLVQQLADQVGIAITHAQILEKEKELRTLKSSFISMTSHEFRTPLAVIGSSTELLQHYGDKLDATKKLKHFERIKSSIRHMTALLEDVLMISKVEAHKIDFHPVDIDVIEFCRDLVEELQQSKTEYQILLAVHGLDNSSEQKSFRAKLDPKLLRQILNNLLTNAVKYSPIGSKVYFDLNCKRDCICFRVRDEGIGIPAEDLKNIFTPFHRAINVGNISGTGLGLAIVHKCVELHQGKITIESEVEVGTTFTVTIPLDAK
ncbi:MAG: ATP-binding protein [Xenococcaceae cyanobacterium MO_188.B32]|nr:ATP-binding protein [Xenococcaceae cyanobacterium MO_188.B32]